MPHELRVPANVNSDPKACELIRAWAANGGLVCSLNTGAWPEDQASLAWGILLSDIARHVSDALRQKHGSNQTAVLSRMREVFDAELTRPTPPTGGKFA